MFFNEIVFTMILLLACAAFLLAGARFAEPDKGDAAFPLVFGIVALVGALHMSHRHSFESGKGYIAKEQDVLRVGDLYRVISYCEPCNEEVLTSRRSGFPVVIQEVSASDDIASESRYVFLSAKPDPNAKLFRAIQREGKLQLEAIAP